MVDQVFRRRLSGVMHVIEPSEHLRDSFKHRCSKPEGGLEPVMPGTEREKYTLDELVDKLKKYELLSNEIEDL